MLDVYYKADSIEDEKEYIDHCLNHPEVFCKIGDDSSYFFELKIPHLLALLANSQGMMKIGDTYVLYSNDYVYKSKSRNSLLSVIQSGYRFIPADVTYEETHSNIGLVNEKSQYSYKTSYFDSKHRIVGRLYKYQSGNYYYEGYTTAQKKGFLGIWFQETISMINFSRGSGYATDYPDHLLFYDISPVSVTYYNKSEVGAYIVTLLFGFADNAESYCPVSHSGTRSGENASITTSDAFN